MAQRLAQGTHNPLVLGSNPRVPTHLNTGEKMLGLSKKQLSDGFYVASLLSVAVSIGTWILVSPEDPAHGERFALFIGLWAPTLMGLANFYNAKE